MTSMSKKELISIFKSMK